MGLDCASIYLVMDGLTMGSLGGEGEGMCIQVMASHCLLQYEIKGSCEKSVENPAVRAGVTTIVIDHNV